MFYGKTVFTKFALNCLFVDNLYVEMCVLKLHVEIRVLKLYFEMCVLIICMLKWVC